MCLKKFKIAGLINVDFIWASCCKVCKRLLFVDIMLSKVNMVLNVHRYHKAF